MQYGTFVLSTNSKTFLVAAVVLDVLDVCESVPRQTPAPGVVADGQGDSGGGETKRVEHRRVKLTDVWQPRKKI
jgi:hypothetical protein